MSKRSLGPLEIARVLFAMAVGAVVTAVFGIHQYMTSTALTLHPDTDDVPSTIGATPPPEWSAAVDRARDVVRAALAERNLPGLSVAVGSGGQLLWSEGLGWADLDSRRPVTPDTRFRVGTASKVLTSAAAGLLLEANALDLDADIQTWVPQYPRKDDPVTLRQLMAHTAGVRTDGGDEGPFGEHCANTLDGLRIFADRSLLFEPGTRYRYSSYGWILVSAAIEAAAGQPFLTFMQERVLEPLGMHDTVADSASDDASDRATAYFPRYAAEPRHGLHLMRDIDLSCYAGASVYVSTPSDLVRFGMGIRQGTLLRPATVDLLQTGQHVASGEPTGYGLGWDLETVTLHGRPTRTIGHDGTVLGGMAASLTIFPEHDLVVAITSNISYADTASLAVQVAEAFVVSP